MNENATNQSVDYNKVIFQRSQRLIFPDLTAPKRATVCLANTHMNKNKKTKFLFWTKHFTEENKTNVVHIFDRKIGNNQVTF